MKTTSLCLLITALVFSSCSDKVYTYRKKVKAGQGTALAGEKKQGILEVQEPAVVSTLAEDPAISITASAEAAPVVLPVATIYHTNAHQAAVKQAGEPVKRLAHFRHVSSKNKTTVRTTSEVKGGLSGYSQPVRLMIIGLIVMLIGAIIGIIAGVLGYLVSLVGVIILLIGLILFLVDYL